MLAMYVQQAEVSQEEMEKSIAFKSDTFLCFRIWKPDLCSSK